MKDIDYKDNLFKEKDYKIRLVVFFNVDDDKFDDRDDDNKKCY